MPRTKTSPASRLRLRLVHAPGSWLLPLLRRVLTLALLGGLALASYRYLTRPFQVGALEFTPHVVGIETSAVGVKGVAATDMDADGDIDVVTTGKDGTKVYINDGGEKFEAKLVDNLEGERVQVIDLNKDGTPDLLVNLKGIDPGVRWYDNRGAVEFNEVNIGSGKDGVAYAGDIDGDGAPDIVTALNQGGNIVLSRWMNNGTGTFAGTTLDANSGVTAVTIGDIDGNGYNDVVTGGVGGLRRWKTSDGFTWSRIDIDDGNQNGTHLVVVDVDHDGKADIVTGDVIKDLVAWYDNQDNSTWKRNVVTGDADAKTVAVRDLDEDDDEDFIVTSQDQSTVYWYENNGKTEFTQRTVATGLQGVYGVAVADIDSDDDFDLVTGDFMRGTVWWYERLRAKPVATKPTNISQATDGSGRVTFETTISDADSDPTRVRVQYSRDGVRWDKPWITKVKPSEGTVDLKNSHGYQVGAKNPIDTTNSQQVTLTFTWDTKSVQNTGGAFTGDVGGVRLRVIPRDDLSVGEVTVSSAFRVDLEAPKDVTLKLASITEGEATLAWTKPRDSSAVTYKIYYGTDAKAVLEQRSEVWDGEDDEAMNDFESTSTTIKGLSANKTYTFKLFATDKFGNSAGSPSVAGKTVTSVSTPTPAPEGTPTATPAGQTPTPTPTPGEEGTPTPIPTPTPKPKPPSTLTDNSAPLADAGVDGVVNPSALVIMDGTSSADPDRDSLVYVWRQLSGPRVELLSARTATPSFSAGEAGEAYVFHLSVRDPKGALGTDTVTVAVKDLPEATGVPVATESPAPREVAPREGPRATWLTFLHWLNLILFALAVASTALSVLTRLAHSLRLRSFLPPAGGEAAGGKVVHYQTVEAIAGAQVLIYGEDGKLKRSERTNTRGEFPTLLPAGRYTFDVKADGFTFAPATTRSPASDRALLYTGGVLNVPSGSRPVKVVIPLKPTGREVGSMRTRVLHVWQALQRVTRWLSWPLFLAGALLNTFLVFRQPGGLYLTIEILYVVLVILKVVLEVRVRPAYGLVRDAITHVPLDLAVVRLFESKTNRLVMTRVTNAQGKFFALPPAGRYTITITKPGYGVFSKANVEITAERDTALQLTADLMPIAPTGGLAAARVSAL